MYNRRQEYMIRLGGMKNETRVSYIKAGCSCMLSTTTLDLIDQATVQETGLLAWKQFRFYVVQERSTELARTDDDGNIL